MPNHRHATLVLSSAIGCLLSVAVRAESFTGRVVGVSDGDTIKVMREGRAVRVRLAGVDCPEKRQAFGKRAKRYASDLAYDKRVEVEIRDTDRWGRIVGEVILPDGSSLNQELVRAGLAWWYRKYAPKDFELRRLEQVARVFGRGLWADPDPVPPWEFRRKKRKPGASR
jgi:endonuclease YncB( thermonuclease family)